MATYAQVCATSKLTDCFGSEYVIVKMAGSGFCGFHCLSHCLTGSPSSCIEVIDDCMKVFMNIPELFSLRTNFASRSGSSSTLHDYQLFMLQAVEQVRAGQAIESDAWCEDAHMAAVSLVYDIAIFVYSTQTREWHVFNELGSRGYVCLLNTIGHFDVLHGVGGAPIVPAAAHTHCVTRRSFGAPDDVWQHLQREYCLRFVFKYPERFPGVTILNKPMVSSKAASATNETDVYKSRASLVSGVADFESQRNKCDVPGCTFVGKSTKSLRIHKTKLHRKASVETSVEVPTQPVSIDREANDVGSTTNNDPDTADVRDITDCASQSDTGNVSSTIKSGLSRKCDVAGCTFVGTSAKSLRMHRMKRHAKPTEENECASQRDTVITCDFPGCASTCASAKSLRMHRMNKHCRKPSEQTNVQMTVNDHESVSSVLPVNIERDETNVGSSHKNEADSDTHSVRSMDSTCSRRSERIAQRSMKQTETVQRGQHVCDNAGCVSRYDTPRGLAVHKAKCRFRKELQPDNTQNAESEDVAVSSPPKTINSPLRHTRKSHSKDVFAEEIAELEKEFLPRSQVNHEADPLYDKLKKYHDDLQRSVTNTTTEKLSAEVLDVIVNPAVTDDCDRQFRWSKDDENRLNELNKTCKSLQPRFEWTWGAPDDTEQGQYNDKRMRLCVTKECQWKIIECENCESTGILVGDQIVSTLCYDCVKLNRANEHDRRSKQDAWNKVRPVTKDYPKAPDGQDLPYLQPGDKAVLAPVHPVVTVKKLHFVQKKLRLESISLVQDPVPTWCKVLPRTSLADRFMIIERRVRDCAKYVVADRDRVRQWLLYLFDNHSEFIRLREQNQLAKDEAAIDALGPEVELAEVDVGLAEHTASEAKTIEEEIEREDEGLTDATLTSGFSETHVFSFDRYPELYLKSKEVMRLRKEGKIEFVKDDTVRKPTYCTSANLAFPYLYSHGEWSPLDFQDYKLGRYLLKKQALYAHRMGDGRLQFNYAEDDIHMAHQYSRLSEQTVRATVGYYLSSHPSVAHVPLANIITAFRDGVDQDSGLLDSHLPDLTTVMTQLPNSRQKWFAQRLGIEAISRDIGSPNLFVTINLDPRASPDVRRLIYELEYGKDMHRDEPFVKNTAEFTKLMNKYAPQIAIYLYRKVKIMMDVFFTKICGIPDSEPRGDWTQQDTTETSWWWGRVEFTETRGVPHFHFLVKLPHVLDTGLLGRIIHNGRVVRQELKCGNIKTEKREEAWQMIEMSLLASRYATLFAHSISTASFYDEDVDIDGHDGSKVIRLEEYRKAYAKNYKAGNINLATHPIMRRFDDPECHENQFHEMAQVASVSCLHECIQGSCGGDPKTGDGCRFDFPKKEMKHTVAAVMQVNANQMESRVLLRRTCDRVANLNRYFIRYLRSNHDMSVLIDSAHKLRYATKYCAKSGKHTQLLNEMIEHLNKRSTSLLPPNMKQVLSHLLLADCSHRAFISKQELAYRVMGLPDTMKSFTDVDVVGFYKRANLQVPYDDEYTIEYSDRTEYSAYAERCRDDTELGRGLIKEGVESMCLNEFAQTVQHKWINSKETESKVVDETTKRKFRTRDVNTGHWRLTLCSKRKHTRPSTVLHTAPAVDYEYVEHGRTTTQTTFFDLPIEKRHQLYRAYYELVMYIPWQNSPDETFLSKDIQAVLADEGRHPEINSRHSLQRLEEFCKVYKQTYNDGKVAPPGSLWQKDNQFSYSMFLVSQHNRDIHLDRVDNKGVLKAQYEDVDELVNVDVDIRPAVNDVTDLCEYPTFENFMPPDMFRDIVEQKAPELSEVCVAFPLQHKWQRLEETATHDTAKKFIANPPRSPVNINAMTPIQRFAVDMGKDRKQQILFVCGKAGSGKTAVALKICEDFVGRVQATAYTGKAASLFNGPTLHSMFGWSHNEHNKATEIKPESKKVQEFKIAHEDIELFVVEEALAIPPAYFALMDETMTAAFNPKRNMTKMTRGETRKLRPFGGKKMLFLGDQAQLPPIGGPAVYDDERDSSDSEEEESTPAKRTKARQEQVASGSHKTESIPSKRTKAGQLIFGKYLKPNCVYLQQSQRNSGMLGEICDRMRKGQLPQEDYSMLAHQRTRFPEVCTDHGIHYQNEMCSMHNWRQLWNECLQTSPRRRMFICKATYHVTGENDDVVDSLSTLPPQAYDYAPDVLCVAEGCDVRLLQNVNVAAGLCTSQTGTVVKVIYNNADVNLLLAGEHVVPYCIVVSFATFQGFVEKKSSTSRRIFPFPNQPSWVPIFRKRFRVKISSLPSWIRKKQLEKDCFRVQFPIDLARHITAHRAQGQTMDNCLVSVDLQLENPDTRMPPEIGSLLYVACTRVTKLENLFLSAIHPCIWKKIGQGDVDKHRRTVDKNLRKATEVYAEKHGMLREMKAELAWTPDSSKNEEEWTSLQRQTEPPKFNRQCTQQSASEADFSVDLGDVQFAMFTKPVLSERHIGMDQGEKNFAIAVVERTVGENPVIVNVKNYKDLELREHHKIPKATEILVTLSEKTDLMAWMKPVNGEHKVDRVVVHLEQIDPRNMISKQTAVELGKLLQQQASDPDKCIVKMSQPHIHRATGPIFQLGHEIVETLQLQPALYLHRRSRAESNPAVVSSQRESEPADVEPSDEITGSPVRQSTQSRDATQSQEYRAKKKMSADVFRYIIEADEHKLQEMKLSVDEGVRNHWREIISSESLPKFDDAGDALLHALDEVLCGSTNFRQLVPAAPSVHVNRTVVVAVFPEYTYWIVLKCQWNAFVLENFGRFCSRLDGLYYKDPSTVAIIKANMTRRDDIWSSLSDFKGSKIYDDVEHIKVIVKQLTGHTDLDLTNIQAGALQDSTTNAMKQICDDVIGKNSKLFKRGDKILGSLYSRTSTVHRDRKFQVVNSTGKHTNAVLSCLSWMRENLTDFVENRREIMSEHEKRIFFNGLLEIVRSGENTMEMVQLSDIVKTKFCSDEVMSLMKTDVNFGRNIADLVVIGISKNQHHVKAVAANSRKTSRLAKPVADIEEDDVEQ